EGPVHAEVRVNEHGPFVIELAARSIGGLCSRTLRFGTRMTLEGLILRPPPRWEGPSYDPQTRPPRGMMIPLPRARPPRGRPRRRAGGGSSTPSPTPPPCRQWKRS